ncbi:MAG: AmmeMemoRadiSam system protein B [Candidatus Omnitrophota bacterium]
MTGAGIRKPVVAGYFYPQEAAALKRSIENFIPAGNIVKKNALGCVLPHAGYVYSASVAVETAAGIKPKNKIILLGPNHTGIGETFSIMTEGAWQTPLGIIEIDSPLAKKILQSCRYLRNDARAHAGEHSLEVELPILQFFFKDFQIVPIAFLSDELESLKEIGKEIAAVIIASGLLDSTLLVASSDMTHYEPQKDAQEKDAAAIEAILELNPDKLMQKIRQLNITMCGYAPVIVMLSAAKALGAIKGSLIKYLTSGDATGDKTSVVGYAGITIA